MNAAKVAIHSGPTHPQPTGDSSADGRGLQTKTTTMLSNFNHFRDANRTERAVEAFISTRVSPSWSKVNARPRNEP